MTSLEYINQQSLKSKPWTLLTLEVSSLPKDLIAEEITFWLKDDIGEKAIKLGDSWIWNIERCCQNVWRSSINNQFRIYERTF